MEKIIFDLSDQLKILKAISNPIRLAIVNLLYEGEKSVSDIIKVLEKEERTKISKHLKILRENKIIDFRKEKQKKIYFLKLNCVIESLLCSLEIVKK